MFRFSKRKVFFPVTLGDFVSMAQALEEIVKSLHPTYSAKVFVCDTGEVYEFSKVTIITSEVEEYLFKRKECDLAELDDDVVGGVFKLEFILKSTEPGNNLLVSLTWDIHEEGNKLFIYCQCFGDENYSGIKALMNNSFLWRVDSGYQKSSAFNMHYIRRRIFSRKSS